MSIRRLLGLALIASMPGVAGAQFTTFIPPRDRAADSVKTAVVAEQKAQTDSLVHTQLTNMKTWVDSAAGIVPTTSAGADSMPRTTAVASDSGLFRNGARAPATASALPVVALLGAMMVFAGVVLVRTEPRRAEARARRGA